MVDVVLEKVSKVYPGGVQAVREISLHVKSGEFVVLVGPSGCGKSTTLRMIAGLEEITEGIIRIGDRVVNDVPPKDRDIAMVFQNYALYPHMTVYKNMAFALKLRKFPKAEIDKRVRDAAEILGIGELLNRRPKALSGGQRQRVAVGRAIVRHPKASLFDEPLSNLDAKLRVEMRAELKRLHRRLGTTTIYVTHDQEEAMTLGDRIVVMKDGVVHQAGAPLEVYERPVNRFVAGFVGTPPMNFLEGRLLEEGGELWFDEGASKLRIPAGTSAAARGWAGKDVVMGIRPEATAAESPQQPPGAAEAGDVLPVSIGVVEPLGEKMDLYVSTPRHPHIVARVPARRDLAAGTDIRLRINMDKVHLFEPGEEGKNISLG
jgi:multiple sugar transport system ATP-binding protein